MNVGSYVGGYWVVDVMRWDVSMRGTHYAATLVVAFGVENL
jgi:hypothetical protein